MELTRIPQRIAAQLVVGGSTDLLIDRRTLCPRPDYRQKAASIRITIGCQRRASATKLSQIFTIECQRYGHSGSTVEGNIDGAVPSPINRLLLHLLDCLFCIRGENFKVPRSVERSRLLVKPRIRNASQKIVGAHGDQEFGGERCPERLRAAVLIPGACYDVEAIGSCFLNRCFYVRQTISMAYDKKASQPHRIKRISILVRTVTRGSVALKDNFTGVIS